MSQYILRYDWLPERARQVLSCPLGTTRRVSQEKFSRKPYNKSFIGQACLVMMAGYWPRSFFSVFLSFFRIRLGPQTRKKMANIQPYYMASSASGQDDPNRAL